MGYKILYICATIGYLCSFTNSYPQPSHYVGYVDLKPGAFFTSMVILFEIANILEVHDDIAVMTTYIVDFTPAQYLLHHSFLLKSTCHKSLALLLVNVSRCYIPSK